MVPAVSQRLPPLTPLKAARGSGTEAAGFFFSPSRQLILPLFLSALLFIPPFLLPALGKAGARKRAALLLQRSDLTLTRQERLLRCIPTKKHLEVNAEI